MEEEIKLRIERTEEILKRGEGRDKRAYIAVLDLLRKDYESINNRERAKEISREIIEYIERNKKEIEGEETGEYMRNAYDTLARNGDFEAFMIAMEWNRPIKSQFYLPRRRVLKKHGFIQGIQDLLDRKIKMLVIEAPPGIRKKCNGRICVLLSICNAPREEVINGRKCEHVSNWILPGHIRLFNESRV